MGGMEVVALVGLGALHGLNPAMGWLFAVGLGLQEKKGRAVWRALPPLALGHALSVAVVVAIAAVIGRLVPPDVLRWAVAAVLFAFGADRLLRGHRHVRYGGMRVTPRELTLWSFLMATAHGAGLMVLPFVFDAGSFAPDAAHAAHAAHAAQPGSAHAAHATLLAGQTAGLTAALIHALSYLLVTGVIAVVVYHWFGLKLLRTAWINLDVIWACVLLATSAITLLW